MNELAIIIPVRNPDEDLLRTAASLAAQTNRQFSVLFCDNHSRAGLNHLAAAQDQLTSAGILVTSLQTPVELNRLEHWNWAHSQSAADWHKPLFSGEQLLPDFVERFRRRVNANPLAQFIRCDAAVQTEWGTELLVAPFEQGSLAPLEVLNYFPACFDWLSHSLPFVYGRSAWLALGGYSPQLPGNAALNLNLLFALHFGVENIAETLATANSTGVSNLNENRCGRVNHWLELWLILRQAENYCRAAKLPWPEQCLLWRSFTAALGRW